MYLKQSLYFQTIEAPVASPGGREQWERPPQTREICKGWGTTHASASSEPRKQEKIQIFVNLKKFLLKVFSSFKIFLITFKIFNKIIEICSNFF